MKCPNLNETAKETTCLDNTPSQPATNHTVDYSEYMWMGGDLEEFDRKVVEECLEEEFIERCFEEMHQEEEVMFNLERAMAEHPDLLNNNAWLQQPYSNIQVTNVFILNPDAPEFIPRTTPQR